jgi:hypothetical protein
MGKMVLDVGTEHDSRLLAINHESAPDLLSAQGHNSSFVDSEAHSTALLVEEAGIDSNNNGVGCNDLLYGERSAAAPSYTAHFESKLCPRLLDNQVGFLRMKAMIASM